MKDNDQEIIMHAKDMVYQDTIITILSQASVKQFHQ